MSEENTTDTTPKPTLSSAAPCSPRPRPDTFGYEEMDGFGEHGQGGWQLEGGEEAYDAAIAAWEKANNPAQEGESLS